MNTGVLTLVNNYGQKLFLLLTKRAQSHMKPSKKMVSYYFDQLTKLTKNT